MGREEGGGFRMGNTCIPVADSFRYLAKLIQYCKKKINIIKKKKKNNSVTQSLISKVTVVDRWMTSSFPFSFPFSEVGTFRSYWVFWLIVYILQILMVFFFITVEYTLVVILWKHWGFSFITFSTSYNPNLIQKAGSHHGNDKLGM